jgi:hypothetical protein
MSQEQAVDKFHAARANMQGALGALFGLDVKSPVLGGEDVGVIVLDVPTVGVIPVIFQVRLTTGARLSSETVMNLFRSTLRDLYAFDDPNIAEVALQRFDRGEIRVVDFIQAYGRLLNEPNELGLVAPKLPVYLAFKGEVT